MCPHGRVKYKLVWACRQAQVRTERQREKGDAVGDTADEELSVDLKRNKILLDQVDEFISVRLLSKFCKVFCPMRSKQSDIDFQTGGCA